MVQNAFFPIKISTFELNLSVRHYELNSFGVKNNAEYQNYLEHTLNKFLYSNDLEFTACFSKD